MVADNKVYEIVTDKIVAMLEGGTIPWQRPWDPTVGVPMSLSTRKAYRGVNPFILGVTALGAGYTSPWWGTYDQCAERAGMVKIPGPRGGRWVGPDGDDSPRGVRKGEKATLIVFWSRGTRKVMDEDGNAASKSWATLRYFNVFNADQVDAINVPVVAASGHDHEPIEAASTIVERYLAAGGPGFQNMADGAYYMPDADIVNVPPMAAFDDVEGYYATSFHELTHSTGHRSRLKRDGAVKVHRFGDEIYSKEELIAEMGAAMLCGVAGIDSATIERSAAYIENWLGVLKGDKRMVVMAAAAAQRASDLILGVTYDKEAGE